MAKWEDEDLNKILTVMIDLPAGVTMEGEDADNAVKLEPGGQELTVRVKWPTMMLDTKLLHRKWEPKDEKLSASKVGQVPVETPPAYPDYYPRIMAIKQAYAGLRRHESEVLYSVAHIQLPMV